jgi:hypothetical protein
VTEDAWRLTRVALLIEMVALSAVIVTMWLMWEFYGGDTVRYNEAFRQWLVASVMLGVVATVVGPWITLRGTRAAWSPAARRAAPFVGLASLVTGFLAFLAIGRGGFFALEALIGPIHHNSLWGLPVLLGALLAGFSGAAIGPILVLRAAQRCDAADGASRRPLW